MSERLAIVGTGVMGRNHARTAQGIGEGVVLSHVVDTDPGRARSVVAEFGNATTQAVDSIDKIDGTNTDAAIIATPSQFHAEQAGELMRNGVHVLVEKPIALTLEDAEALQHTAQETGKVLMVGHVELFNPTVNALRSMIGAAAIKTMRFKRLSNVSDMSRLYHDVVNDLMLHDISIAYHLSDAHCEQNGAQVLLAHGRAETTSVPDPAEAIVRFGGSIDAHFRASRAYVGGKVRTAEVETDDAVYQADLMTRAITKKHGNEGIFAPDGVFVEDIQSTNFLPRENQQPLTLEQLHFIRSIRGETTPAEAGVSVEHAIRIMKLTRRILQLINQSQHEDDLSYHK